MVTARVALGAMVLVVAVLAVPAPAAAGSEEDPEIVDANGDQVGPGGTPACATVCPTLGAQVDLRKVWVEEPIPGEILFAVQLGASGGAHPMYTQTVAINFQVGGADYQATAVIAPAAPAGNGAVTAGGVASAAVLESPFVRVTIPLANVGEPASGAVLDSLFVQLNARLSGQTVVSDRAPNGADFGRPYTIAGMGAPVDQNDTDADGLNDTWEMEQFGNLTAQNGTGDPDGDGLNNTAEYEQGTNATVADTDGDGLSDGNETELGTNATLADTDGDGISDGDEVANGTDPLVAEPTTIVDGNTTLEEESETGAGTDTGGPEKAGFDKYLEAIKDDTGYAGASAGGLLGVVVLSLLGIAVRWGL